MKKSISILLIHSTIIATIGCQTKSSQNNSSTDSSIVSIGGDRDAHGCLSAAGQTWSQLRNDCVQIFAIGTRLDPKDIPLGEAVISAFALLKDDNSSVELFLPDVHESILVPQNVNQKAIFENEIYRYDHHNKQLFINNELEYESKD